MVEIPWEKVKEEIHSPGGACVSVIFNGYTSHYRCWLCGVNPSEHCRLTSMKATANNEISREWLLNYARETEAARG